MNIIELLMVEHASIRLLAKSIRENNLELIYELDDYVRNCHAKVEDEVVFPKLKEMLNSEEPLKALSRLEADHKLIDKIGDQVKAKTIEGDVEIMKKRALLYVSTLEFHNSSEENSIFPFWVAGTNQEEHDVVLRSKKMIEDFGIDRYFKITGISKKLFDSVS